MYSVRKEGKLRSFSIVKAVFVALFVVAVIIAILNRVVIRDFIRGLSYSPTAEMADIRDKLRLTGWGNLVFNASQPVLSTREEFNTKCKFADTGVAVLGCYSEQNIYVYNITEKSLDGIRELTAAHELLHAIYARLSQEEKTDLEPMLRQIYDDNLDLMGEDLETYPETERLEEVYVRAGTEIKNLPKKLEEHYAKVFEDQDMVAGFYSKYIAVFNEIEARLEVLMEEMDVIRATIDEKTVDYNSKVATLDLEIEEFNSCADTAGCFKSSWEFNSHRSQLIARQNNLMALYDEISDLTDQYNAKVNEYNDNVLRNNRLNQIMNSNQKIESME